MAFKNGKKKTAPTLTSVRRSQTISTYGIGSLIPVDSESFIVLGQDEWPMKWINNSENFILEPGFANSLGVKKFITPPSGSSRLPVQRFPQWVSCGKCNRLAQWWELARKSRDGERQNLCKYCNSKDASLITSRFVAACTRGHIEDFPYKVWVHKDHSHPDDAGKPELYLDVDPRDESLRGMQIRCTCGAIRSMEGALGRGTLSMICHGKSPWLPAANEADCEKPLFGLQRGATRVWQADMRSAISIDADPNPALEFISENWENILDVPENSRIQTIEAKASRQGIDVRKALDAYKSMSEEPAPDGSTSDSIRIAEYQAFGTRAEEIGGGQTFVCLPEPLEPDLVFHTGVRQTARVPRLKEIRALTGFSRVDPVEDENLRSRELLSATRVDWLPAIEAYGEGIFVELNNKAVDRWEQSSFAQSRAKQVNVAGHSAKEPNFVTPRELLIHSLSHALLSELALKTGYPASSIRERLYAKEGQAGILLYTSTSDSAGSLGGLCAQGSTENFLEILESAIATARWCSADPVCIESSPHGVENRNLAACHYCMLAPEVSCERHNSYLDRACLVGTPKPKESDAGFFSSL